MKIALIKETKTPIDNRVALSPKQVAYLNSSYPGHKIVVQSSVIRAYSDEEYVREGVEVVDSVEDCDLLFGIKEASIDSLIPDKHYVFFGHIAKMQEYNRPLLQAFIEKNITFTDYEYMVNDDGVRVCAFGWWAGVVGVYYTLRGYGLRMRQFDLPKPDRKFTLEKLKANLCSVKLPRIKIVLTGAGRVSQGAQYILSEIGAHFISVEDFLSEKSVDLLTYTVADVDELVTPQDPFKVFSFSDFSKHPESYRSEFSRFAMAADMLICCHFWAPSNPVYLTSEDFLSPGFRIKVIGDVTCDIMGSVKSTLRSSTHDDPYYDYNPFTKAEEDAFSSDKNITVMAVDTCPNALAIDTSAFFGEMLIQHVLTPLLENKCSPIMERATIVEKGKLTSEFSYLAGFAKYRQ